MSSETLLELANLADLEDLQLYLERLWISGNQLSGCVPDELRDVLDNDLYAFNLSACTDWVGRRWGSPYCYLWLDSLSQKVREEGRIVNVSVAAATAVNAEVKREIVGKEIRRRTDVVGIFPNRAAVR